jgi:prepilin signal peptidase PulO-like enzyme (type II secretory pathway)
MLCSCFVLSFDVCIVTITWSLLFVVIDLWVIYLTRLITLPPHSSSGLPTLVCFLIFHRLTRKHLALLTDVVSGFKSLCEAPHLARKCGTYRSDIPVRDL